MKIRVQLSQHRWILRQVQMARLKLTEMHAQEEREDKIVKKIEHLVLIGKSTEFFKFDTDDT